MPRLCRDPARRPVAAVPSDTPEGWEDTHVAVEATGAVVGARVDDVLASPVRLHPAWGRLAWPALSERDGLLRPFVAEVAEPFRRYGLARGVVGAFTAQLEVAVGEAWLPVVRYDSAHGRPHRDTLDWAGNVIDKHWLPEGRGANEALIFAENELTTNADRYRDEFLGRRP